MPPTRFSKGKLTSPVLFSTPSYTYALMCHNETPPFRPSFEYTGTPASLLSLLLLDLVHEIEIALVEMMHAHVAILATAGVAAALGIDGDGVEGPEVALDAADLVLEDAVVEARFELALAR